MGARVPWDEVHDELVGRVIESRRRIEAGRRELEAACAECGDAIGMDGRWYSDGVGSLVPYCEVCAEVGFPVL